jgi:hypothetical protein
VCACNSTQRDARAETEEREENRGAGMHGAKKKRVKTTVSLTSLSRHSSHVPTNGLILVASSNMQHALEATIAGSTHAVVKKPEHRGILTKFGRAQTYNTRLVKLQRHTQLPLTPIPPHHSVVNPSEIPEIELNSGKLQGTDHRRLDDKTEIVFTLQELTATY